jgi:hypothetical protein
MIFAFCARKRLVREFPGNHGYLCPVTAWEIPSLPRLVLKRWTCFLSFHLVKTEFGTFFKQGPGCDADHSPPSSAKVMYEYKLYLLSPHVRPWHIAGAAVSRGLVSHRTIFLFGMIFQVPLQHRHQSPVSDILSDRPTRGWYWFNVRLAPTCTVLKTAGEDSVGPFQSVRLRTTLCLTLFRRRA